METLRQRCKAVSVIMVILLLTISVPFHTVFAALVTTEEVVTSERAVEARRYIRDVLAREEIQAVLTRQGVDPLEAQARVASLTDAEAIELASKLETAPAGGVVGVLLGIALIVFIVLVITDALGYTDVFPFVKSKDKSDTDTEEQSS